MGFYVKIFACTVERGLCIWLKYVIDVLSDTSAALRTECLGERIWQFNNATVLSLGKLDKIAQC